MNEVKTGSTGKIVVIIVGIIVLIGFASLLFSTSRPTTTAPTVTQTIAGPTVTVTSTPTLPSTPMKYTFSGTGNKETETFTIPTSEWKMTVTATAEPDVQDKYISITIYAYSKETGRSIGRLDHEGRGTDYGIVHHGPGNYYLQVLAANCEWQVTVTAPP